MSKRTYPLTAAVAMGASGMRCPQIIEDPTDRRIPYKIEIAEGYYILHYSEESLPRSYVEEGIYGTSDIDVISAMGFAEFLKGGHGGKDLVIPMKRARLAFGEGGRIPASKMGVIGERGPEPVIGSGNVPLPKHVGIDLARPGSERTVIHITNPTGDSWVHKKYEAEARKKIAAAFQIPEEHLRREGHKFIYEKKASQKPEERVYDASAWTGRKPRKPSPDLTLAEAWAEFEAAIEEVFSKSWILRYLRTFVALEDYIDDDGKLRVRRRLILAVGRSSREDIKKAVRRRNSMLRMRYRFRELGQSLRDLSDGIVFSISSNFRSFNKALKEVNHGRSK